MWWKFIVYQYNIHLSGRSESPPCHIAKCKPTIYPPLHVLPWILTIYSCNLLTISLTSSCMFVWFSKQYLKSKIHRSLLVHDQISFVMCFLHSYEFPITDYTSFYVMTCKRAHHFAGCLLEIKLWLMGTMHSMLLRSRQIDLSGWGVGFASHSSYRFYQLISDFFMTFRMTMHGLNHID